MRFEFNETSDIREQSGQRDWNDIFKDNNDEVQDIPEDVENFSAEELEPEVQDIPDDIDWNAEARGMSLGEMDALKADADDVQDHMNDEKVNADDVQDHMNDEKVDADDVQDHMNDEKTDADDIQDNINEENEDADNIPGHFETKDTNDGGPQMDLKDVMADFSPENWEGLSDAEKKEALGKLGEYAAQDLGLENPPEIKFYSGDPNEYGYYTDAENCIYINENNMSDPIETADTITHETRHCWQHERADHPQTEEDYAFADNFNNYVSPDMDFQAYEDQIVEADAREYADKYRDLVK